ncbi:MAG: beta-N-acetylhexosaminidase [Pseudomonadota bacterium]
MKIREKVGRLLMMGLSGPDLDPESRDLLLEIRPGGIILFKRNTGGGPGQIATLVADCQNSARDHFQRRLFTAIDQEGGPVRRLGPPFTQLPSQREMSRLTVDQARALGETSGRELASVGLNFNLAPVMDVNTDPSAAFMAERSFGPDPDQAAHYGAALIEGHAARGVLTCLKHFPGIGDVKVDPHHDLPTVDHPEERLRRVELVPFVRAVGRGAPAVMSAHVNFPALDPDWPGTFSHKIMTGILRMELGFSGLVLTDDLEMGAVVKNFQIGPAAVRAVRAGCDLLLVCSRPDLIVAARDALVEALETGEITPDRLEQSLDRADGALALIGAGA